MNRTGSVRLACAVGAVAFAAATSAYGQATYTWTGAIDTDWSKAGNWTTTDGDPLLAPGMIDFADFNVGGTVVVDVPATGASYGFIQLPNFWRVTEGQANNYTDVTINVPVGATLDNPGIILTSSYDYINSSLTFGGGGIVADGGLRVFRPSAGFGFHVKDGTQYRNTASDAFLEAPKRNVDAPGTISISATNGGQIYVDRFYFQNGWYGSTSIGNLLVSGAGSMISAEEMSGTNNGILIGKSDVANFADTNALISDGGVIRTTKYFRIAYADVTLDNGTLAAGSTNRLQVQNAGVLMGNGTISNFPGSTGTNGLSVENGGTVSPGTSLAPIGLITIAPDVGGGSVMLETAAGANLLFDIASLTSYDQIALASSIVSINGGEVVASFAAEPTLGDTFDLVTWQAGGAVTTLPNLSLVGSSLPGQLVDTGTALQLQIVPEPASLSLLALGGLALRRRRA